jgi:hypothetical protein
MAELFYSLFMDSIESQNISVCYKSNGALRIFLRKVFLFFYTNKGK